MTLSSVSVGVTQKCLLFRKSRNEINETKLLRVLCLNSHDKSNLCKKPVHFLILNIPDSVLENVCKKLVMYDTNVIETITFDR